MSVKPVTQSVETRLIAILTNSAGAPVEGLTYEDVVVSYRKAGGAFQTKDLTPTAAVLTSEGTQTFDLANGQTLIVEVGGVEDTATFLTAGFADIDAATAAEVFAVLNASIGGQTASASSGAVVMTSTATGDDATLQVTGGTANTELDFDTSEVTGSDYWYEIGNGLYEIRFTSTELNTEGTFVFTVAGSTVTQYMGVAEVTALDDSTTESVALSTCILTGHVLGLDGTPVVNAAVSARLLSAPQLSQNTAWVSDDLMSVRTDSNGMWSLTLPRLAFVEVFIPATGLRRQLTCPNAATARMADVA